MYIYIFFKLTLAGYQCSVPSSSIQTYHRGLVWVCKPITVVTAEDASIIDSSAVNRQAFRRTDLSSRCFHQRRTWDNYRETQSNECFIKEMIKNGTMNFRFQAFSLARRTQAIPAVPNKVKERVSNKASWKHFWQKAVLDQNWPRQKSMLLVHNAWKRWWSWSF